MSESWVTNYRKHLAVPKIEKCREIPWVANPRKGTAVPKTGESLENPWVANFRKAAFVPKRQNKLYSMGRGSENCKLREFNTFSSGLSNHIQNKGYRNSFLPPFL